MTDPKELLEIVERKERKARVKSIIYSVIPITLAIFLIIFTSNKVTQLNEIKLESDKYRDDIEQYKMRIDELEKQIKDLQHKLQESTNFAQYLFQIDWADAKMLFSRYPRQARILEEILRLREGQISWKIEGYSIEEGFDSPSFATYLLNNFSRTRIARNDRYNLKERLRSISEPQIGDLIFYERGFCMFYFIDDRNTPFCVGMTPAGILALNVEFGPRIIGYGAVNYNE